MLLWQQTGDTLLTQSPEDGKSNFKYKYERE